MSDDEYHWKECECGEVLSKSLHYGGTATVTEKAICSECNQPYGSLKGKTKLTTPSLAINTTGLVSWTAIPNASSYKYIIDNGSEQTTTNLTIQLEVNQTVKNEKFEISIPEIQKTVPKADKQRSDHLSGNNLKSPTTIRQPFPMPIL